MHRVTVLSGSPVQFTLIKEGKPVKATGTRGQSFRTESPTPLLESLRRANLIKLTEIKPAPMQACPSNPSEKPAEPRIEQEGIITPASQETRTVRVPEADTAATDTDIQPDARNAGGTELEPAEHANPQEKPAEAEQARESPIKARRRKQRQA